jgi:tRNA-dihydrouridine synthase
MHKFWENPISLASVPEGAGVPESLQIGSVQISPATVLAPMAGVTDTVFRRFIRNASFVRDAHSIMSAPDESSAPIARESSGCGLIMTEFTSADGLFRTREKKRKRYLHFYEDERPTLRQRSVHSVRVGKNRSGRRI